MASLEPLRLPTAGGTCGTAPTGQAHRQAKDLLSATRDTMRLLAAAAVSVPLLVMMYLKAASSLFMHVLVGAGRAFCAGAYWLVFWPKLLLLQG